MREMHKWKDKVELSLDNRQIFFLFFGLSVVGCFVFALGVMVGRRVEWNPEGEVAALSGEKSLALLGMEQTPAEPLSFKEGLSDSATAEVPPTRDPSEPPRDEDEVKAEKKAAAEAAKAAKAEGTEEVKPAPKKVPVASPEVPHGATLASGSNKAPAAPKATGKKFTLQMKAFSRGEEAEAFAAKLRANGHQVRVEAHEVKGRIWHRVRLGTFDTWADGLAAKQDFEAQEKVIAYVVRH
ncbi:MAG: SPOR domain-containing protein [Myxococcota bacterium]